MKKIEPLPKPITVPNELLSPALQDKKAKNKNENKLLSYLNKGTVTQYTGKL